MDINGINSKNSQNALEQIKLFGDKEESKTKVLEQPIVQSLELDQAEAEAFNSLKSKIREATDEKRAAMIAELRQSFLTGELNSKYQGTAIADALLADGYGEFLIS